MLDSELLPQLADGGRKIQRLTVSGSDDRNVRLDFLHRKSFCACRRSHNGCVDNIAVEDLPLRKIEIDGVSDKDIALASFAKSLAKPKKPGLCHLKNDAAALGTAVTALDPQRCHAHDYAVGVGP